MRTDADDPAVRQLRLVNSYLRELVSHRRKKDLRDALGDDEKRRAYELTDGARSAKDVKEDGAISVSARSILRWWNAWIDKGLAERLDDGSVIARYDAWVMDATNVDE